MMEGLASAGSFGPAGYFWHGHRRAIGSILWIVAAIALISVLPPPGVFGSAAAHLGGRDPGAAQAGGHGASAGESDGPMTLAQAPSSLQQAVADAFKSEAYEVTAAGTGPGEPTLRANNPAHGMVAEFAPSGVSITPDTGDHWKWGITPAAYGYRGSLVPMKATSPVSSKDRVEYRRGPITEWYVNTPQGLEQGFTVESPPPGRAAGGPLLLRLHSSGTLLPRLEGDAVMLGIPGAAPALTYSKLLVTDATGRLIPSRLRVRGSSILVVVHDAAARYPLTVDPVVAEQQKLTAPDGGPGEQFGFAVALSGDTAVVGAYLDHSPVTDAGSAYVFVRSGTTWAQQQKLTASDLAAGDNFGVSVALIGDTAVVGAYLDDTPGGTDAGSAYVFVRSGTTWTEQQKLTASDGAAGDNFGLYVALDVDTAVVGANLDNTGAGADAGSAYVFVRSGTTWTEQQKLTASDGAAVDRFGRVALDGDTAVVGARDDDTPAGADAGSAYVFVRSGTTWTEQQKLTASDGVAVDRFGVSVALSGDTAVVGSFNDDTPAGADAGSAYVFVRSGTTWTEQQKLTASDGAASDIFGVRVALDGDTAVVGAYLDDTPAGVGAGSAYVFGRSGTTWTEQQKLTASDGAGLDNFGASVALEDDIAVVGAPLDDTPAGFDAGSAYVFRIGDKLTASDGAAGDIFGASVALDGDTAVIGAYGDNTPAGADAGSAYVFERSGTTWTEQQKLTASDGAHNDRFGVSVALSGDTAVVGAYVDDTGGGADTGSAYVFVRSGTTWTEQQKLTASDGAPNDFFGRSVALSGETAVVGAYVDDTPAGANAGSAYVFVRSGTTWTEQQKLTASDAVASDNFGFSVAVSGDTAVVGAPFDNSPGTDAGSAYVFVRSGTTWTEQQKLTASDAAASDNFGVSVALGGDTAVVGALNDDTPRGTDAGSAYVFVRSGTTWTEQQKLTASDGAASDIFGVSVAVGGDTAVVGAYLDDTPAGVGAGSAYVFVRSGTTWTEQQKLAAPDGAAGDQFGLSVSLSGDTAVVGAYADDTAAGVDAGSAYVFELGILVSPVIDSFTPPSGVVGKAVTVLGSGFTGATEVDFNGTPAVFTVVSDSQIDTSVPNGALTGPITVTTPGGSDTSDIAFKVKPKVQRFIPTSGPVGTVVTITGTAFTGATRVQFNGVNAVFTVNSYTQITATVPAGATTGFITVTTPGGKGKSKTVFTVT